MLSIGSLRIRENHDVVYAIYDVVNAMYPVDGAALSKEACRRRVRYEDTGSKHHQKHNLFN